MNRWRQSDSADQGRSEKSRSAKGRSERSRSEKNCSGPDRVGQAIERRIANKRRLLGLVAERLEQRYLLAVDSQALTSPVTNDVAESIAAQSKIQLVDYAGLKPTAFYTAGTQQVSMAVMPNRIAINFLDPNGPTDQQLNDLGLQFVRQINSDFAVYESNDLLGEDLLSVLNASGLVEDTTQVLYATKTGSEAVLLDELIVALDPGVEADEYFTHNPVFEGYRSLPGTPDQFVVKVDAKGTAAIDIVNQVVRDQKIVWVEPNLYQSRQKMFFPNDPRFVNQWHLHNTGQGGGVVDADSDLPEAWDVIPGGSSTLTIGIIDDGVVTNHPDLNNWVNVNEIPNDGIDNDNNGWIDDINGWNFVSNNNQSTNTTSTDRHGTAVAGVAAARGNNGIGVAGASYNSMVMSARIFEGTAVASDANIAAALYYMGGRTRNGLGTWKSADVVNNSWGGGGTSSAINVALQWGTTQGRQGKGATYLFATGNDFVGVSEPAIQSLSIPGVVAVGAANNFAERSLYSNYGPAVDLVTHSNDTRPGYLAIDTTDRPGTNGYAVGDYTGTGGTGFGGTSSATPLASGITALVVARSEQLGINLNPTQIRGLLRNNTDLIGTTPYDMTTGKTLEFGFGRLNANSAVSAIGRAEVSVLSPVSDMQSGVSTYAAGSAFVGEYLDVTFRVRNQGTSVLNLNSLNIDPGRFTILSSFRNSALAIGEATTFVLRFTPSAAGTFSSVVSINSNDADESNFTFTVSATGVVPSIGGGVFEDFDGDGVMDDNEPRLSGRVVYLDSNSNGIWDDNQVTVTTSSTGAVSIPDLGLALSPITVSGFTRPISDVNVRLNIQHANAPDLIVSLIAPTGQKVQLLAKVGGTGANFTGTLLDDEATTSISRGRPPMTGSFRPQSPLSAFDGLNPNGVWQLEVVDGVFSNAGQITSWDLILQGGEDFTFSKASGGFGFSGLPVGPYSVRTVLPTGWTTTTPAVYSGTLTSTTDSALNLNFGAGVNNRFYGQVFNDTNRDGIFGANEQAMSGRTLFEDVNGNQQLDPPTIRTTSNTTPVIVPDGSSTPAVSTVTVSGVSGRIFDVNLRLNISTTYDGDLTATLVHPDGTRVVLFSRVGGSGDNFTDTVFDDQASTRIDFGTAPFTGSYRPFELLSTFNGKSPNGTWRLEILDPFADDQATLNNWDLILTSGETSKSSDANGFVQFDLFDGTSGIMLSMPPGWDFTSPSNGRRSVTANGSPIFNQTFGARPSNVIPLVAADRASVSGNEGGVITNTGTWSDANSTDIVTLSASTGAIVKNANGTWNWSITASDDIASTLVTVTADDGSGGIATTTFTYSAVNLPPVLTAASSAVTVNVLDTLTNTGTWSDVAVDTVTLSASIGSVVKNANGTWSWSMPATSAINNQTVIITGTDEDGGSSTTTFSITAAVAVTDTKFFYKDSFYARSGIANAIDPSKSIAKSGTNPQTLSFANVSNFSLGINGIVLDVAGLASSALTAADFAFKVSPQGLYDTTAVQPDNWTTAATPTLIDVVPATTSTPARVRIEWTNNAIENRWLQIRVLANARTGLTTDQVFYMGHLTGEINGTLIGGAYIVSNADLTAALPVGALGTVDSVRDVDRNGLIVNRDFTLIRSSVVAGLALPNITIPASGSAREGLPPGTSSLSPKLSAALVDAVFEGLA